MSYSFQKIFQVLLPKRVKTETIFLMAVILAITAVFSFSRTVNSSDGEETAVLPEKSSFGVRLFETDKFLITGNKEQKSEGGLTMSPEVGLSHTVREREKSNGFDNVLHKIHAQAGGRVSFNDNFYLGFATKLPIYNYEATQNRSPGGISPGIASRHEYEILKLSPENLTWTGEASYRINTSLRLNIYYDRNRFNIPEASGASRNEEVFGTRFDFHFK